jgi:hypothetical protein
LPARHLTRSDQTLIGYRAHREPPPHGEPSSIGKRASSEKDWIACSIRAPSPDGTCASCAALRSGGFSTRRARGHQQRGPFVSFEPTDERRRAFPPVPGSGLAKVSLGTSVVLWSILLALSNWEPDPNEGPLQWTVFGVVTFGSIGALISGQIAIGRLRDVDPPPKGSGYRRRSLAMIAARLDRLLGVIGLLFLFFSQ